MNLPAHTFGFRRIIASALGAGKELKLGTKIIMALTIFLVSYATKSLQAVDLIPAMYTTEQPFGGLTDTYDRRAASILKGEGLLGPYNINPSRTVWLAQAPGYSIFLSGVYALAGRDFFKVQLVQNGLNSISPVLIFLIAGGLLGWRAGVVSGLIAALSHHLSHISNFILPDSLSALPVLAAFYVLMRALRSRNGYLLYALAGAMIGVSVWLRSQVMLLGIFAALPLTFGSINRRAALRRAALLAATSLVMIAPITIRNYMVYGRFVPVNIGAGIVLWEGIGESSGDRFGAVAKDDEVAAQDAVIYNNPRYAGTWSSPDGVERDRDRVKRSLRIIVENPLWYAGVMLARMRDMVKYSAHAPLAYRSEQAVAREKIAPIRQGWEERIGDSSALAVGEALYWLRPVVRPLQRILKEAMLVLVILGALIVYTASLRRGLFFSIVPLYYFLFQSFMHTEFRYTLPMQYFLFTFAAVAWVMLGAALWRGFNLLGAKLAR